MTNPLWRINAADLTRMTKAGEVSAAEAVEAHVARMEEANPAVNAVVVDLREEAREAAAALDAARAAGRPCGPLHGVPVLVKENVDCKGQANLNGVEANRKYVAPDDSPVVRNLRKAGAIPIGLTNTPEWSMRVFTDNPVHGLTKNPWDETRTCGGSSGGSSAAVAAGITPMGHGNDIAGSLRVPAACCGLATIRPSLGRVPVYNPSAPAERPLMAQLMSVQGPMCRDVADTALFLEAMAQPDSRDPWQVPAPLFDWNEGPRPLRFAVAQHPEGLSADPRVLARIEEAGRMLEDAGHTRVAVDIPDPRADWELGFTILLNEMRQMAGEAMLSAASDDFRNAFDSYTTLAGRVEGPEFMALCAERTARARRWQQMLLDEVDVVLTPVTAAGAPKVGEDVQGPEAVRRLFAEEMVWITMVNILGLPAATTPAGFVDDLPVGVQIIAARYREDRALRAAAVVEAGVGPVLPKLWDRS